ncbi:MAG: hypothetical protein HDS87_05320 [Bacteroidales bacterium]|nr:hypothetical protein [Bacteroidales bacterium]
MKLSGKFAVCLVLLFGVFASCSSDDPEYKPAQGNVEEVDGSYISVFTLSSRMAFEFNEPEKVTFHITSSQLEEDLIFEGLVSQERGVVSNGYESNLQCRLFLNDVNIPDGDYYISISGENIPDLGVYKVSIRNRAVTQILQNAPVYKGLSGQGTKDDPYLLKSSSDLECLMACLRDDPDHGMGLYFSMTDDVDVTENSALVVGTASFQGFFNGNNHRISGMKWESPAEGYSWSDVGLFSSICNATIENLILENVSLSGIEERGGMLAGSATGRVSIENVTFSGSIMGRGQCIGGLIGDVNGAVTFSNIIFDNGSVTGKNTHTGALVGSLRLGNNSTVSNVLIRESIEVYGDDNTAGLFGYSRVGRTLDLKDLDVEPHVVKGRESVGVYFGYVSMVDENSLVRFGGECNYSFADEVYGDKSVGNIAGHVRGANGKTFEFASETRVRSNIIAFDNNAGGVFGYASDIVGMTFDQLVLPSSLMTVTAFQDNAGGVVGYANHVRISDDYTINPKCLNGKLQPWDTPFADIQVNVKAMSNAGVIAGLAESDSSFEGFLTGGNVQAVKTAAGGIIGRGHEISVKNCEFQGSLNCPDLYGGIIGLVDGKADVSLSNCTMQANSPTKWQGGLIGYINLSDSKNSKVNIFDSYFCGDLYFGHTSGGIVAGIRAADSCDVKIERCANFGYVVAGDMNNKYDSYQGAGGIVGMVDTSCPVLVRNCFNQGSVNASVKINAVGGIVGIAGKEDNDVNYTTVENCINLSNFVDCEDADTYLGGVVGHLVQGGVLSYNQSTIRNCVNWGEIRPDTKHDTGGILGYAAHQTLTERCYNRGKVYHGNAIIGTHKTGTVVYHQYNYFLAGSGGDWPDSVSIPLDNETDKSLYKKFQFTSLSSASGFVMTNYGPIPSGIPMDVKCGTLNPWPGDLKILD